MIAVIGCGNMANAVIRGFHKKNQSQSFITYDPNHEKAQNLAQAVGGQAVTSLAELSSATTLLIACKPQHFRELAQSLNESGINISEKHIISIMAALPVAKIAQTLDCPRVSRVMPNTPALVGQGVSLILHSPSVEDGQKKLVDDIFQACGVTIAIDKEKLFDQVTTVTGSGPAYVFLFAQTMIEKLQGWGLDEEQAERAVKNLFLGSSQLMVETTDKNNQELIDQVTSKGGVTIEAVKQYRQDQLQDLTSRALDKAFDRAVELQNELS